MGEEKPIYTLLNCSFRSAINEITEEYLSACDHCRPHGFDFDELTSFRLCRMTLQDKFMSIDWINYLYHQGELQRFRDGECRRCRFSTPEIPCQQTEEEVEKCWLCAEQEKWDKHYSELHKRMDEEEEDRDALSLDHEYMAPGFVWGP